MLRNSDEVTPTDHCVDIEGLGRTEYRVKLSTVTAEISDGRACSVSRLANWSHRAHRRPQFIKLCVRAGLQPIPTPGILRGQDSLSMSQLCLAPNDLSINSN
jgi:hypothetical protein